MLRTTPFLLLGFVVAIAPGCSDSECERDSDCDASLSSPLSCDTPDTCQGSRSAATCDEGVCKKKQIADDSACDESIVSTTCSGGGEFVCSGEVDQDLPTCGQGMQVEITQPQGTAYARGTLSIHASVSGEVPELVEIYAGDDMVGTVGSGGQFDWDTTGEAEGTYEVVAVASKQLSSHVLRSVSEPLMVVVDRTAPSIVRSVPEAGGAEPPRDGDLVVELSEPVDPTSVTNTTAALRDEAGAVLTATRSLSADGRVLTFSPSAPFAFFDDVVIHLTNGITDLAGNPLPSVDRRWRVPLWRRLGTLNPAQDVAVANTSAGPAVALVESASGGAVDVRVYRWDGDAWQALGGILNTGRGRQDPMPRLAVFGTDLVAAWAEAVSPTAPASIFVARFDGSAWSQVGGGAVATGVDVRALRLAADSAGGLAVAYQEFDGASHNVRVRTLGPGASFADAGMVDGSVADDTRLGDLALDGGVPVVAVFVRSASPPQLYVKKLAGTWGNLGGVLQHPGRAAAEASLAAHDGDILLAYVEADGNVTDAFAQLYDGGSWTSLGAAALDLDVLHSVRGPSAAFDDGGAPVVAFEEGEPEDTRGYVRRWDGSEWRFLGANVKGPGPGRLSQPELAVGSDGEPVVAYLTVVGGTKTAALEHYEDNVATTHTPPLARASMPCVFSGASDTWPQLLSQTGCYADVPKRIPAAGALPVEPISVLWTDGAKKARYVFLPSGTASMSYAATGSWDMPEGTVVMKEFLVETRPGDTTSQKPMETRFLVKGAGATWQGVVYKWNATFTDATLSPNAQEIGSYPLETGGFLEHFFPSRDQCLLCHGSSGRMLSLQTIQMNRNHDYGEIVDNQIRAFDSNNLFGVSFSHAAPSTLPRLSAPGDTLASVNERMRGYFQGNCAHCHQPGGYCEILDLRYTTALSSTGLCASSRVVPGDHVSSLAYKLVSRNSTPIMPAIGSLVLDPLVLPLLAEWIDDVATCP